MRGVRLGLAICSLTLAVPGQAGSGSSPEIKMQLVDRNGKPLAGVGITIGKTGDLRTEDALTRPTATSDGQGQLRVSLPKTEAADPYRSTIMFGLVAKRGYTTTRIALGNNQYYYTPWGGYSYSGGDRDLGRIVLEPAGTLKGRVRGQGGRPLAGAVVTAIEPLHVSIRNGGVYGHQEVSVAISDAKGHFELVGVPEDGVSLELSADGYYDCVEPFASKRQNIDIAMEPSGFIEGRVRDMEDKPVDAHIYVAYECGSYDSSNGSEVRTDKAGRFRVTRRARGRYCAQAVKVVKLGQEYARAVSKTYSRPTDKIVIELAGSGANEQKPVSVKVVAEATGKPVTSARAAVAWMDPQQMNKAMLEQRFNAGAVAADKDGKLALPAPVGSQPLTGAVLVKADGYAPAVHKKLEYDPDRPSEIEIKLVKGARVRGLVRDAKTGAPLAGAKVKCKVAGAPTYNPYYGYRASNDPEVVSGADGRFELSSLPHGRYELEVQSQGRPTPKVTRIELAKGEERGDVVLEVPIGVTVSGRVFAGWSEAGAKLPFAFDKSAGWRVKLTKSASNRNRYYYDFGYYNGGVQTDSAEPVLLAQDGRFAFPGLGADRYRFYLVAPALGKRSRELQISIEPLRVRDKDIARDFDVGEDLPGIVRGRVTMPGVQLPASRLRILSTTGTYWQGRSSVSSNLIRCMVEEDGSFAFRVSHGRHLLFVVDGPTGTVLARAAKSIEVKTGKTCETTLEVPLTRLRVCLRPADPGGAVIAGRLEWNIKHQGDTSDIYFSDWDNGYGVAVKGRRDIMLVVPPRPISFAVRTNVAGVDEDGGHSYSPVAFGETVAKAGQLNTLTIKIPPPESIANMAESETEPAKTVAGEGSK
ncbi:MAG: carboxypeptidase regulatory-like domain-containing protein [Planctomycetes bacterium]|nr:carboxypeptidase regulatory-like domain-containing protein [Planctomycetota bacterium]